MLLIKLYLQLYSWNQICMNKDTLNKTKCVFAVLLTTCNFINITLVFNQNILVHTLLILPVLFYICTCVQSSAGVIYFCTFVKFYIYFF